MFGLLWKAFTPLPELTRLKPKSPRLDRDGWACNCCKSALNASDIRSAKLIISTSFFFLFLSHSHSLQFMICAATDHSPLNPNYHYWLWNCNLRRAGFCRQFNDFHLFLPHPLSLSSSFVLFLLSCADFDGWWQKHLHEISVVNLQ